MTKLQLKEKYTEWNINITNEKKESIKYFKELQDLNFEYGDKKRWCDVNNNVEGLITNGYDVYKTMDLVRKYHEAAGKWLAMMELSVSTDNFKIN